MRFGGWVQVQVQVHGPAHPEPAPAPLNLLLLGGDKARLFAITRGECLEAGAAVEIAALLYGLLTGLVR